MKGVLVVAHGSRRESANREIHALADALQKVMNHDIEKPNIPVSACFLEMSNPTIEDGIELLAQTGVSSIQVLPYFLSAGKHVSVDIPNKIKAVKDTLKSKIITIELLPHIGADNFLVSSIVERLSEQ